MPTYQLHIVDADDGSNLRQPIVEAEDIEHAREWQGIKLGEEVVAVTEVNEPILAIDYPDGHPFHEGEVTPRED